MPNVFAGVDVGGTRIKVGLVDESGQLLSCRMLESQSCSTPAGLFELIAGEIEAQAVAAAGRVVGAGVGCPGRVDFNSGTVLWIRSKLEFLEGVPLTAHLSARLACPVFCDNDANVILAGEMRYGAGRGYGEVLAITVGTGIGGALVSRGFMIRGHNWAAGHFGYMSRDPMGRRHICGNTGIFEEYASQRGVQQELRRALDAGEPSQLAACFASGAELGLKELFEAAEQGDVLGRRLADRLIAELGVLIANLIYAFDPELVLLGGGIMNHSPHIIDGVRRQVVGRLDYLPPGSTEILPMALGDAAGVMGGAAMAMDAMNPTRQGLCALGEKR